MLPMRSVFIKLKKGKSKLWCSLALIHTTYVPHVSDGDKVLLIYFYKCLRMQYLHNSNDSECKKNTTVLKKVVFVFL